MFIIEVLRSKELAPKLAGILGYYTKFTVSEEDRRELEKLYREVARLSDPKSYQHICRKEHIDRVMLFFDMLSKAPLLPP